ncbi:MAG: histidine triad nucleotide-binding protein [bacterium]|nr:histidine triad nucleotide-binding protein [bacterium]
MPNCLFCKIISKEIKSNTIYEDEKVVAFLDINPKAPTHILIVPKKHISTILEMEEKDKELIGHIYWVANNLAINNSINQEGFRVVLNCNKDAGQEVFHIHFHLLGGRKFSWPPG